MSKFKNEFMSFLPYYIVCFIVYYVLPRTVLLFPAEREGFAFAIVNYMIAIPLTCLVTGIIFAIRHGFKLLFPLGVGILFLFSKFFLMYMDDIFFKASLALFIISIIGCGIGTIFHTILKRRN